MKFNGDIIITDPCYIIREPKGKPVFKKYPLLKGKSGKSFDSFTKEETLSYKQYLADVKQWEEDNASELNHWSDCDYGDNMEILGIKNYICRGTIYGNWSCTTYNLDTNKKLGNFCADAGLVAIFLLDEVLKYNPDFDYHTNRKWTTTLIKNFIGEVNFEVFNNEVKVIGKGNINFYTKQTGL